MATTQGKILIVDDDANVVELLCVNLRSEGYQVSHVDHASEAMKLDLSDTQLVIADAMSQEYTGLDLLDQMKADPATEHVGMIITSGNSAACSVIEALDSGADDFLEKPFSLREFMARVRSVMRRHSGIIRKAASSKLQYQSLALDLTTRMVSCGETPVNLTATEFAILSLLLKNIGVPTSRRAIFESVWKDSPEVNNDRIVDTNISRLRKKLGDVGSFIQNRSGLGYLFV